MTQLLSSQVTGRSSLRRTASAWVLCLALMQAFTQPGLAQAQVIVGQALPAVSLTDQHDKPWQITSGTRLVIFAAGRKASNLIQTVLQALPKDQLTRRNALYLADMSKMPGFITRTFALPALKEMPYSMGVSLDEATLAAWPRQADAVTLIELDQGLIKRISYVATEADLKAALER